MVSIPGFAAAAGSTGHALLLLRVEVFGLAMCALVLLLGYLHVLAFLTTYVTFLCSAGGRVWWDHPPGSRYDRLHSIRRFHRTALRRMQSWTRLRRSSGTEPSPHTTPGGSCPPPSDHNTR